MDSSTFQKQLVETIKNSPYGDNIKKIAIFGSYARNEATPESDIDILVELKNPMGYEFFGLEEYLSDNFKKKVDLLTFDSVHPYIRSYINKDKIILYDEK